MWWICSSRRKRSDSNDETVPERTVIFITVYLFIYPSQEPKLVCLSFLSFYGFHNYLLYIYGLGSPTPSCRSITGSFALTDKCSFSQTVENNSKTILLNGIQSGHDTPPNTPIQNSQSSKTHPFHLQGV